jgi:hypothetical protein
MLLRATIFDPAVSPSPNPDPAAASNTWFSVCARPPGIDPLAPFFAMRRKRR